MKIVEFYHVETERGSTYLVQQESAPYAAQWVELTQREKVTAVTVLKYTKVALLQGDPNATENTDKSPCPTNAVETHPSYKISPEPRLKGESQQAVSPPPEQAGSKGSPDA